MGSALARLLLDDDFHHHHGNRRLHASDNESRPRRRPIKLALLEQRSSPPSLANLVQQSVAPHPRAYALSPASLSYLGPSVLQSLVNSNRCGIYDAMQIWEHDGPAQLHFVGEDLEGALKEGRLVDLNSFLLAKDKRIDSNGDGGNVRTNHEKNRPWLGAVIEDASLVAALWDELRNDDRIDLLDNVQIKSIRTPSPTSMGNIEPPPPVQVACVTSTQPHDAREQCVLSADLLVAADGANSFVKRTVGSFPTLTRTYGRKAVTCTVELDPDRGMARTAFQRFLPHGPIALLPVWTSHDDGTARPLYANVVWSTLPSEADRLLSLSSSEFVDLLNRHLRQGPSVNPSLLSDSSPPSPVERNLPPPFVVLARETDSLLRTANAAWTMGTWTESPSRNYFRMPPRSTRPVGPLLGFDLSFSHVVPSFRGGGYASPRVALVGDAAHTMHPMAGQGLNLGLGDVRALAEGIKEAIDCGMDVGGTSLFLDRYNEERMWKGWGIVGGVHGLHEAFGWSGSAAGSLFDGNGGGGSVGGLRSLIGYGRSLGMNIVNGIGPVRRALAEVAAGATPRGFRR